jgi:nitrate reductase NapE
MHLLRLRADPADAEPTHSSSGIDVMEVATAEPSKWREGMAFVILAFLIWPFIAAAFVGVYGLAFWSYFMLAGPPGPQ